MHIKKILIFILSLLVVLSSVDNAYLSLNDFKDGVEKSGKTKKKSDSSSDSDDSCISDLVGGCITEIGKAIGSIWIAHNLSAFYSSYPYEHSGEGNFICNLPVFEEMFNKEKPDVNEDKESTLEIDTTCEMNPPPEFDHTYFITTDIGGQWARDEGSGIFATLRGKITRIIGPEIEYKRIIDDDNHLDYLAIGLNLSIFQHNYFSPDFYLQYARMSGIAALSGVAFGVIANLYPVKPLHIMIRIGKQFYSEQESEEVYRQIDFIDFEWQIGFMLNRFELFAGYRHIETDYAALGGPICGIRFWF